MYDKDLFARVAEPFGVEVTPELAEKLGIYAALLVEWNQKMNLTAITDPVGIAVKHFADSLTAAAMLPQGDFSLIDVGTGAGFPGVPLALYRPDCRLTLLDSLNKRLTFLDTVCRETGLTAQLVHARAEEGDATPPCGRNTTWPAPVRWQTCRCWRSIACLLLRWGANFWR